MLIDKTIKIVQLIIQVNNKSISMHTELHIVLTHHFHAKIDVCIELYTVQLAAKITLQVVYMYYETHKHGI